MRRTKNGGGLFCELYWGENLSEARSVGPEVTRVLAAADEGAPLPLYGFTLPEEPWLLGEPVRGGGYRIYPPPAARVEFRRGRGPFEPVPDAAYAQSGGRRCLALEGDTTLRLVEGALSLRLQPSVVRERAPGVRLRELSWLALAVLLFLSAPLGFLLAGPDPTEVAESNARTLSRAREREAEERRRLGVDTPLRPLAPGEGPQRADAGVWLPASVR
jgi:hypothetical protein